MKNRDFAHTTVFGVIDITARSYYREKLAWCEAELDRYEAELEAQNEAIKSSACDYNSQRKALIEVEKSLLAAQERVKSTAEEYNKLATRNNELQQAYNGAKMRLQKYERKKGSNGRFIKQQRTEADGVEVVAQEAMK